MHHNITESFAIHYAVLNFQAFFVSRFFRGMEGNKSQENQILQWREQSFYSTSDLQFRRVGRTVMNNLLKFRLIRLIEFREVRQYNN